MAKRPQSLLLVFILCAMSLAGCTEDSAMGDEYTGPISLIVYYDTTSGQIEETWSQGTQGQTTGVSISFDLAGTTSSAGAIVSVTLDPGDGTTPIEQNVGEDGAEISYEWLTHGLFMVAAGAIDSEGNAHNTTIKIRVDKHITYGINNVNEDGHTMTFRMSPDNDGPLANRVSITSTADNGGGGIIFGGGTAEVTWELKNAEEALISSEERTVADNTEEEISMTSQSTSEGDWTLFVSSEGDTVTVNHDVSILYTEGSESPANPRP